MSVVAFAAMIVGFDTEIWRKQEFASGSPHPVLGARYQIWNQALVEWRMHPIFGIGNSNFDQAPESDVKNWLNSRGENYPDSTYAVHVSVDPAGTGRRNETFISALAANTFRSRA